MKILIIQLICCVFLSAFWGVICAYIIPFPLIISFQISAIGGIIISIMVILFWNNLL